MLTNEVQQMKRWVTMALSVATVVGVGYFGEKAYLSGRSHDQDVESRLAALSTQVSDLNDRLIATSRDEKDDSHTNSTHTLSPLTLSMAQVFPQHWLKQTLQLAQSQSQLEMDQQTSSVNAFESSKNTLNLVKSNLNSLVTGHAISELTASALARAIDVDLKMIDSQAQTQRQERQLLDRHIAQLQLTLDAMARQGPSMQMTTTAINLSAHADAAPALSFTQRISRLFVIEKPALNVRENMLERGLVCREVALTLGLARQALAQGQSDRVMQLLVDGRTQLAGVVDPAAKQIQASIAALSVPIYPKLQLTALQWVPAEALIMPVKSVAEVVSVPTKLPQTPRVVAS